MHWKAVRKYEEARTGSTVAKWCPPEEKGSRERRGQTNCRLIPVEPDVNRRGMICRKELPSSNPFVQSIAVCILQEDRASVQMRATVFAQWKLKD